MTIFTEVSAVLKEVGRRLFVRLISRKWPPAVGGMETYSVRLAEWLPKHCELNVIALPGKADGSAPGAFTLIAFGLRTFLGTALSLRPADVTHIADLASWPIGLASRLRRPSSVIVLSAHGTDVSFAFRSGVANKVYRSYLLLCKTLIPNARMIANSSATASALRRLGFQEIRVIPLAADIFPDESAEALCPHILFAGRLVHRKGLSWFVANVLEQLPPEIELHVAGPVWEKSEEACLDHRKVRYLGSLEQHELRKAYRRAQCVIVPNLNMDVAYLEGFGLVAPEAAAAGGVVLGSATGGLTNAILDGKTGFLLPAGDANAWSEKINEVLSWNETIRGAFVSKAQETCWNYYNWDRVARETFETY